MKKGVAKKRIRSMVSQSQPVRNNSELISTGIQSFDEIIGGGILRSSSVLLSGAPGTGKTLMGMHFLSEGAKKGEPGLFIAFEDSEQALISYAKNFNLDFGKAVSSGLVTVISQALSGDRAIIFGKILELVRGKRVQRMVIDSLTLFESIGSDKDLLAFRRELAEFLHGVKIAGVTLIATSERTSDGLDSMEYKTQDFLFEGLVLVARVRRSSSYERVVTVSKMRGQDHELGIFPFTIDKQGITVFPKQLPFSLLEEN